MRTRRSHGPVQPQQQELRKFQQAIGERVEAQDEPRGEVAQQSGERFDRESQAGEHERQRASGRSPRTSASGKRSTSRTSASPGTSASQRRATNQSTNGSSALGKVTGGVTTTARRVRVPVLAGAAAAAVAGGALVKRQLAPKRRKVLGVPVPRPKVDGLLSGGLDLTPVAKGIANAGKRAAKTSQQLRKLSDDVEQAGKTAQKVGDSLS